METLAEVDQRVADGDRTLSFDPVHAVVVLVAREDLDAVRTAGLVGVGEPQDVGAAVAGLLRREPELLHQLLRAVPRRGEDLRAEPFHEALRVALVPRCRQHDQDLTVAVENLVRHRQRIEEQQTLAVVDCVRRDLRPPRLARVPLRMRCSPVPNAVSQLAHAAILEQGLVGRERRGVEETRVVEDATRRTRLASERTYLAWWRTGLTTLAVSWRRGYGIPNGLQRGTVRPRARRRAGARCSESRCGWWRCRPPRPGGRPGGSAGSSSGRTGESRP